jgi:ABC-type transport system substrate-binding protein
MRTIFVGTGPYMIKEWVVKDKTVLEAVPNHWRKTAAVKQITVIEVLEASARRAMLETGEVAAASPALKDWPALLGKGFKALSESGYEGYNNIAFGGNWWEWKSAQTGEVLKRNRDITKPWVGNPYEKGETYDENTPSMQKSRKVRLALALAVDRAGLSKSITGGIGKPNYFGYEPPQDSKFFKKGKFPSGWEIPYDIAQAKQLMKEAGYEKGFEMDFWVGPTGLAVELMEAVAGTWQAELGVKTNLQKVVYETFRPELVNRTVSIPFMGCGDGNSLNNPIDAARGFTMSSWSAGGYGVGMELPQAAENYRITAQNPDAQKRINANIAFTEWSLNWGFCIGVVSAPGYSLYNTKVIADWKPLPVSNGGFNNFNNLESIVLK